MFFNHDGNSITFVGFNANSDGKLVDPITNIPIEGLEGVLSHQLHIGLKRNGVNFSENYQLWDKMAMMEKMSRVMGLGNFNDPDPSYVLTIDNMIKILAIQMRFRSEIIMCNMHNIYCMCMCIPHLSKHFHTNTLFKHFHTLALYVSLLSDVTSQWW